MSSHRHVPIYGTSDEDPDFEPEPYTPSARQTKSEALQRMQFPSSESSEESEVEAAGPSNPWQSFFKPKAKDSTIASFESAFRYYQHIFRKSRLSNKPVENSPIYLPLNLLVPGQGTVTSLHFRLLEKEIHGGIKKMTKMLEKATGKPENSITPSVETLRQCGIDLYTYPLPNSIEKHSEMTPTKDTIPFGTMLWTTGELSLKSLDSRNTFGTPARHLKQVHGMEYAADALPLFDNQYQKYLKKLESLPLNQCLDATIVKKQSRLTLSVETPDGNVEINLHCDKFCFNQNNRLDISMITDAYIFNQLCKKSKKDTDEWGVPYNLRTLQEKTIPEDLCQSLLSDVVEWQFTDKNPVDWFVCRVPFDQDHEYEEVENKKKRVKQPLEGKARKPTYHIVIGAKLRLNSNSITYGTNGEDGFIDPKDKSAKASFYFHDRRCLHLTSWLLRLKEFSGGLCMADYMLDPIPRMPILQPDRSNHVEPGNLSCVTLDSETLDGYYDYVRSFYTNRWQELPNSMRPVKKPLSIREPIGHDVIITPVEDILESIRPSTEAPMVGIEELQKAGLKTRLFGFQRRAVAWMWSKELHGGKNQNKTIPHPFWHRLLFGKIQLYMNEVSGTLTRQQFLAPSNEPGGFLSDEMGLGKTVETLALILLNPHQPEKVDTSRSARLLKELQENVNDEWEVPKPVKTTLIVAPAAILEQWIAEIKLHIDKKMKVARFKQNSKNRGSKDAKDATLVNVLDTDEKVIHWHGNVDGRQAFQAFEEYDIILASYETLQKELQHSSPKANKSSLLWVQWYRLILDEAQMVAQTSGQAAQMANELWRCNGWTVTGTPVSNDIMDLHGVLVALDCDPWASARMLQTCVLDLMKKGNPLGCQRLRGILQHVMWRNAKKHVQDEFSIPPTHEQVMQMEFSKPERVLYDRKLQEHREHVLQLYKRGELAQTAKSILPKLLDLRQLCLHPQINANMFGTRERMNWRQMLAATGRQAQDEKMQLDMDLTRELIVLSTACRWLSTELTQKSKDDSKWSEETKAAMRPVEVIRLPELDSMLGRLNQALQVIDTNVLELQRRDDWLPAMITYFHHLRRNDLLKWMRLKWYLLEEYRQFLVLMTGSNACGFGGRELDGSMSHAKFAKRYPGPYNFAKWPKREDLIKEQATIRSYIESSEEFDMNALENGWRRESPGERYFVHDFHYTTDVRVLLEKKSRFRANAHLQEAARDAFEEMDWDMEDIDRMAREEREKNQLEDDRQLRKEIRKRREQGLEEVDLVTNLVGKQDVETGHETVWNLVATHSEQRWKEGLPRMTVTAILNRIETLTTESTKKAREIAYTFNTLEEECRRVGVTLSSALADASREDSVKKNVVSIKIEEDVSPKKSKFLDKKGKTRLHQVQQVQNEIANGEGATCIICLEPFTDPCCVRACLHRFCFNCITSHLHIQNTCPVCRIRVNEGDLIRLDMGEESEEEPQTEGFTKKSLDVQGEWGTKISVLVDDLKAKIKADSEFKAVVFSTWNTMLDFLYQALEENDVRCLKFYGSVDERDYALRNIRQSQFQVILVPLRGSSGAAGLTLTMCQYAYLMEPTMNPGLIDQAISRVSRIGQTKETTIVHMIISKSIEEKIRQLQLRKRLQAHYQVGTEKEEMDVAEILSFFDIKEKK